MAIEKLTDDSPMPFGKHEGVKMRDVPASYLDWLRGQPWIKSWPAVHAYIRRNEDVIDEELEDEDEDPPF